MTDDDVARRAERCRLMALQIGGVSLARTVSRAMQEGDSDG